MRKEIFIAVLIGLGLGLIVTYGVYTANNAISNKNTTKPQTTTIPTPTPIPVQKLQISVATPEDNIVVTEPEIIISGLTRTNVIVAIILDNNQYLVESGNDGSFSKEIELEKGTNTIKVSASDTNQISQTKTLHIVYSTELEDDEEEN